MSARSILFADLAGFTAMTEIHGDDGAASVALRFYEMAVQALCGDARIVKTIGDAVMVVATRPEDALSTVLALKAIVDAEENFPSLRAGIHCGLCAERADDFFGAVVNLAARIASFARTGQILCSDEFRREVSTLQGVPFEALGPETFKNVSEPVTVFRLIGKDEEALRVVDPVCRMHVDPVHAPARLVLGGKTVYFCSLGCVERYARSPKHYGG
ncbi:MAG: YHS domain-containing protein [Acidobacteria bacterium]|nr:YHS domain-containing protein [Acidobacteriota bacterium]